MRSLYLLRHAKAAPQEKADGDRERPLADRGLRASRAIGGWMEARRIRPDLALCSSAQRTRQTIELVLAALESAPKVIYEDELYLAEARALLARLRKVPAETMSLLLVGHNPGLHELALLLSDGEAGPLARRLAEGLPTAALACFTLPDGWAALGRARARLVAYVTPKDLARAEE